MKKQIPAIVLTVFGVALTATHPVPGLVFVVIGVATFVMTTKKTKKKTKQAAGGPVEYKLDVILNPKADILALRTKNPTYKNPKRNTGRPVYQYQFFDEPCQLVPTAKTVNVMYGDILVGYISGDEAPLIKEAMAHLISEPRLTIFGGGMKTWGGEAWAESTNKTRAQVTLQYMR